MSADLIKRPVSDQVGSAREAIRQSSLTFADGWDRSREHPPHTVPGTAPLPALPTANLRTTDVQFSTFRDLAPRPRQKSSRHTSTRLINARHQNLAKAEMPNLVAEFTTAAAGI